MKQSWTELALILWNFPTQKHEWVCHFKFVQKWSIATQKYWPLGLLIGLWEEKGAKLSYWLHTGINF